MAKRRTRGQSTGAFLDELGRDLTHLGAAILSLAETVARRPAAGAAEPPLTSRQLGFLIAMRHARAKIFGPDLVGPGWSVLLELYRARLEGRAVRLSRLAIDARIPSTTALRWLDQLADRGLIERRPDPDSHRAILVALTDEAAAALADHFAALKAGWALG